MSLKLISLNIQGHQHLDKIIPFFQKQKPDIICLQEVFKSDLSQLCSTLSMQSNFFPMLNIITSQLSGFPPMGLEGLAILTKNQPIFINHQYYNKNPNNLSDIVFRGDTEARVLAWLNINKNNTNYTIATTHFNWALPKNADQHQAPFLKKLLLVLKNIPDFVLCGDFNASRSTQTYKTLSAKYQSCLPNSFTTTIDPNLHIANKKQSGKLKLVVDHFFSTQHYKLTNTSTHCGISDHCAIIANIDKIHSNSSLTHNN